MVFNPHPQAIKTSIYAINLLNRSVPGGQRTGQHRLHGGEADPGYQRRDDERTSDIPLLVATGGPGVVTAVLSCGKRHRSRSWKSLPWWTRRRISARRRRILSTDVPS